MNKNLLGVYLFLLIGTIVAQKQISFVITGSIKNNQHKIIYLHHKWDEKLYTDSTIIKNSQFAFKGQEQEVNMYWLTFDRNPLAQPNITFFADKGETKISMHSDSIAYAKVIGGVNQTYYAEYRSKMTDFVKDQQALYQKYNQAMQAGDANTISQVQMQFSELNQKVKSTLKDYIKKNPASPVSGYIIYQDFGSNPNVPIEELEELVSYLDKDFLNTKFGKLAQQKIMQANGNKIGKKIMEFAQNDADGKSININDFKGKYVLIDFWASWCGPCRMENPNVVAAYNKFKDKGFTVLGISLDQNKMAWVKAVEKDGLTWTHVSDLKGWNNEVAQKFGITSIPQNILVDKDGVILAKNLRGEALEQKLAEIFGK